MNENKKDNTQDDVEIIEAQLEDYQEENEVGNDKKSENSDNSDGAEDISNSNTLIVKKGGFLSSLAFIMSMLALVSVAYLYLQPQNTVNEKKTPQLWKKPFNDLSKQINSVDIKINKTNKSINNINQLHGKTTTELQSIQGVIKALKSQAKVSAKLTKGNTVVKYDDIELKNQLSELNAKLLQQSQQLKLLKKELKVKNKQYSESIAVIKEQITSQGQINTLVSTPIKPIQNQENQMAVSALNASQRYLLLDQTKNALKTLKISQTNFNKSSNPKLKEFSAQLNQPIEQLAIAAQLDVFALGHRIDQLASQTHKLQFNNQSNDKQSKQENNNASWYDKLITIRKIDDSQGTSLTKSEELNIKQKIQADYAFLKALLINKESKGWVKQNNRIIEKLKQYFPSQSLPIINNFNALKKIDINPSKPDLQKLIQQLENLLDTIGQ